MVAAFTRACGTRSICKRSCLLRIGATGQRAEVLELPSAQEDNESAIRPFVKAVAEVFDTLTRTTTEMDRLREGVAAVPSVWRRLFGRLENLSADRIAATITGLRMSERRVERLMRPVGLEPVECVGRPFDPEMMEAVEAIAGGEHPAGTGIEELHARYLWNGRAFRFAQVREERKGADHERRVVIVVSLIAAAAVAAEPPSSDVLHRQAVARANAADAAARPQAAKDPGGRHITSLPRPGG